MLLGCQQEWTPPDHPAPVLISDATECAALAGGQQANRAAWIALKETCNFGFAIGPIVKTPPALDNPVYICSFTYLPGTRIEKAADRILEICRTRGTTDEPVVPSRYNACLLSSLRQVTDDAQITEMETRCLNWSSRPDTVSGFRCLSIDDPGSDCVS